MKNYRKWQNDSKKIMSYHTETKPVNEDTRDHQPPLRVAITTAQYYLKWPAIRSLLFDEVATITEYFL